MKWIPPWGENRIAGTVESRPDWVISRQRSWGVPLPVFYSKDGKAILDPKVIRKLADLVAQHGSNIWFELDDAALAKEVGLPPDTTKGTDTIDVWIDSGVSHKSVCAVHPELRDPADMYLEATDQHRGWFQSSLMTSIALNNRAPYKIAVTHGFVVDLDGKKISKSGTYENQPLLITLSASMAPICCDFGRAALITRPTCRSQKKSLRASGTRIAAFATRSGFCLGVCMISSRSRVEGARDQTVKVTPRDSSTSLGMTFVDRWILNDWRKLLALAGQRMKNSNSTRSTMRSTSFALWI